MCVFLANQLRKYRFLIFSCKKESFLDQKIKVWKKSNKSNFLKGVSPQFLSKTRSFYYLCFLGKSSHKKNRFWKFWIKKNAFETRKRKFSKGLVHGFGQKSQLFIMVLVKKSNFFITYVFLAKLSKKRSFFDSLNKQDCFLDQKNRVLEKSKRSRFDLICKLTFIVHKARKTSVNILPQSCSSNWLA